MVHRCADKMFGTLSKPIIYHTVAQEYNGTGPAEPAGTSQVCVPLIKTEPATSPCRTTTIPIQAALSQEWHRI